jgi:hypothetical protein
MEAIWRDESMRIEGRFYYVALRQGKPTIDDLVLVAFARIINFAIPRQRIATAMQELKTNPGSLDPFVLLTAEARDLFMKTHTASGRSGELGELLLYMLIEWALEAPIVACKMYLKTSEQMPIHGRDGVHIGYQGDALIVYWGESKLHKSVSSAVSDLVSSIGSYASNPALRDNEIRLIRSGLNIDHLGESTKDAIRKYFNPYEEASNKVLDRYACLIGFDSGIYGKVEHLPDPQCDAEFRKLYETLIDEVKVSITAQIKDAGLERLNFSFFLLPFPSVDAARSAFQKKLWGPE